MSVKWTKDQLLETKAGQNLFGEGKVDNLTRSDKMRISRKKTTELTKWAIDWMNETKQFQVHRSNNFPSPRITRKPIVIDAYDKCGKPIQIKYEKVDIHFKSNNIIESILDISGFVLPYNGNDKWASKHVEIEVKGSKGDTLSDGQKKRIADIKAAGGISFVFDNEETFLLQIQPYMVDKKLAF